MPHIDWINKECELSFVIGHPKFSNQGYASELVSGMIKMIFSNFKINEIKAGFFTGHVASKKILEKNKFTFFSKIPDDFETDEGELLDNNIYKLIKDEYFKK